MKQTLMICMIITLLFTGCAGRNTNGAEISEEEAKSIALSHAGLTTEQVHFIKSSLDIDDGRRYYDVEFYTNNNQEYDYEIDPVTGDIIEYDYDVENYRRN